jgi:hypothetical protein
LSRARTYLKKRILVQNQGGREVQPGGILQYFEDLNRTPNAEFGPKDFFEMGSNQFNRFTARFQIIFILENHFYMNIGIIIQILREFQCKWPQVTPALKRKAGLSRNCLSTARFTAIRPL